MMRPSSVLSMEDISALVSTSFISTDRPHPMLESDKDSMIENAMTVIILWSIFSLSIFPLIIQTSFFRVFHAHDPLLSLLAYLFFLYLICLLDTTLSHPVPIPLLSVDIAEILVVDLKKRCSPIHILDRPFVIKYNEPLFR